MKVLTSFPWRNRTGVAMGRQTTKCNHNFRCFKFSSVRKIVCLFFISASSVLLGSSLALHLTTPFYDVNSTHPTASRPRTRGNGNETVLLPCARQHLLQVSTPVLHILGAPSFNQASNAHIIILYLGATMIIEGQSYGP